MWYIKYGWLKLFERQPCVCVCVFIICVCLCYLWVVIVVLERVLVSRLLVWIQWCSYNVQSCIMHPICMCLCCLWQKGGFVCIDSAYVIMQELVHVCLLKCIDLLSVTAEQSDSFSSVTLNSLIYTQKHTCTCTQPTKRALELLMQTHMYMYAHNWEWGKETVIY